MHGRRRLMCRTLGNIAFSVKSTVKGIGSKASALENIFAQI
jgi:hypothetical protein